MKHLVETKLQYLCGILFLHLAQKQVQLWGHQFSSIIGFRSLNFAQSYTLVYWNRIINTLGLGEEYQEMEFLPLEFTILQNKMVSYTFQDSILSLECLAYLSTWHKWNISIYVSCNGMPPRIFSHSRAAASIHFLHFRQLADFACT